MQGAAEQRVGLGLAIAFLALARGELDVCVDHSGTLWTAPSSRACKMIGAAAVCSIAPLNRSRIDDSPDRRSTSLA